jgi:hypothetical protein
MLAFLSKLSHISKTWQDEYKRGLFSRPLSHEIVPLRVFWIQIPEKVAKDRSVFSKSLQERISRITFMQSRRTVVSPKAAQPCHPPRKFGPQIE